MWTSVFHKPQFEYSPTGRLKANRAKSLFIFTCYIDDVKPKIVVRSCICSGRFYQYNSRLDYCKSYVVLKLYKFLDWKKYWKIVIPKIRNALTKRFLGYYSKEESGIQRNSYDGGLYGENTWDLFNRIKCHWPLESPTSANVWRRLRWNQGARNFQRDSILAISSQKWRVSILFI